MKCLQCSTSNGSSLATYWLLATLPIAIIGFFTYLNRDFQLDDALIYLRYIRNVLEGNGLTYNVGDNFNGLTSQLNSYLVLMTVWLTENYQLSVILLSGLFMVGACLIGGKLFGRSTLEAIFTACVIGSTGYFYSTFGMETTLFLFLIGLSLYLYKGDSSWFLVTLAALLVTRSEGVFLAVVLGVDYLLRHRRLPNWRFLLIAFLIFSIPFLFNYLYYGEILPVTGSAKIGQGQSGLWGDSWIFLNFSYFVPSFLGGSTVAGPIFIGLAVYGFCTEVRNRIAILMLVFSLLLATFYVGLNIPNYHWYYAPFVYLVLIFACRGFWGLLTYLAHKRTAPFVAACGLACVIFGYAITASVSFTEGRANQDYVNIGKWLKKNSESNATVAMVEIGTVGWYSERWIVDILGLVSDYNAEYIGQRKFSAWLMHYQPDYILRHSPSWGHEQSIIPLESNGMYVPVGNFPFDKYVLLQRSPTVSAETIKAYASDREAALATLRAMEASSDLDRSLVSIDPVGLFAHAPNVLHLTVNEAADTIQVGFGIREAAQGLHSEICFQVRLADSNESLMKECIEQGASTKDMRRHKTISASAFPGEQFIFEINCPINCDYAWSYWSQVVFEANY